MAEPFTVAHFEKWAYDLILDNGRRWRVEPFQSQFVDDLFRSDPQTRLWEIVPEGNGKTTLIAGVGMYHMEFTPSAFVPIAASTREQAEIMFRQIEGLVNRSQLQRLFMCQEGYRRVRFDKQKSRLQVYAAEAGAADGVIPTLFLIDELHRHKNLALYRTWSGKLAKRSGRGIVISTAGDPGSEFEETRARVREQAEAEGEFTQDGPFTRAKAGNIILHDWAVPEGTDLEDFQAVAAANPLKSVTPKTLQAKFSDPDMTLPHWRRFTCNQPANVSGAQPFIDMDLWKKGIVEGLHIPPGSIVCLGGDGSRTWDTTVIAWASPREDGEIWVDARVFSVRPDVAHHVLHDGGTIDFDDVEAFILDRFDYYSVSEAAYDPRYLERSMEIVNVRLPEAGIFPVEPSSVHMRGALQAFYTAVAEDKLRHPADAVLDAHVANAKAERGHQSELRRLTKINQRKPIDAVPAMALAVWRAIHGQIDSVYESRDMIEV